MKKTLRILALTGILTMACSFNAMANWEQTGTQWKYKDDSTGTYMTGWQWIDGNNDGTAECYYLDSNGVMASNTVIDGWNINFEGQWIVDNVVQTKVVVTGSQNNNNVNNNINKEYDNSNYDPWSGIITEVCGTIIDNEVYN